jgi:hypothetical protein
VLVTTAQDGTSAAELGLEEVVLLSGDERELTVSAGGRHQTVKVEFD